MSLPSYITQDRHGGFLFRRIIPLQYRRFFPQGREVRKSLRTHHRPTAIRRARAWAVRFDALFEVMAEMDKKDYKAEISKIQNELKKKQISHKSTLHDSSADDDLKLISALDLELWQEEFEEKIKDETYKLSLLERLRETEKTLRLTEEAERENNLPSGTLSQRSDNRLQSLPAPNKALAQPDDDLLQALIDQWIKEKIRQGHLKERSEQTYRQSIKKFLDILGNEIRLPAFDKNKALFYVDQLADFPHNRWKGQGRTTMTLAKVREVESKRLSSSAVDDDIAVMTGFFDWTIKRGYSEQNFLRGLAPKIKNDDLTRAPFEAEEVVQVLSHPCFRGEKPEHWRKPLRSSYYWMPILAIFTGARIEELSRLRKKDIREIKGILAMEIMAADLTSEMTTRRKNTPGKSMSATRVLPIHPDLIALGFLDFVTAQTEGYLFDQTEVNFRRGHSASRDLAKIFREAGVDKTMHQLRHTMRDLLTEGEVDWAATQGIMGHSPGGQSANYGKKIKQNIKAVAPAYTRLSFAIFFKTVKPWNEIKHRFEAI